MLTFTRPCKTDALIAGGIWTKRASPRGKIVVSLALVKPAATGNIYEHMHTLMLHVFLNILLRTDKVKMFLSKVHMKNMSDCFNKL